jgi:hypothetical protein
MAYLGFVKGADLQCIGSITSLNSDGKNSEKTYQVAKKFMVRSKGAVAQLICYAYILQAVAYVDESRKMN